MAEQPLADCSFEWGFEMQESRDAAVVDFANEQFGYGLIPSCTQEEMLMCARPEALAGCAIAPVMQAQEVVLVVGARHMVHCTKPSSAEKFRYTGLCEEDQDPAIMIGVDAFKALLEQQLQLYESTEHAAGCDTPPAAVVELVSPKLIESSSVAVPRQPSLRQLVLSLCSGHYALVSVLRSLCCHCAVTVFTVLSLFSLCCHCAVTVPSPVSHLHSLHYHLLLPVQPLRYQHH